MKRYSPVLKYASSAHDNIYASMHQTDNGGYCLVSEVEATMIPKITSCPKTPPGHGYCDRCASGKPELCRYMMTEGANKEFDRLLELEKNMIPRPDPEVARKAVESFELAADEYSNSHRIISRDEDGKPVLSFNPDREYRAKIKSEYNQAEAALLKLMGVEL